MSKYFPGYQDPFAGIVDDYSTYSGFYHITYEDGDSEEMTEADLELHVVQQPVASHVRPTVEPPKPKKTLVLNLNDKAPGAKTSGSKNSTHSPRTSSNSPRSPGSNKRSPHSSASSSLTGPKSRPLAPPATRPAADGSSGEMNNLIGRGISKLFVDEDGRETIVNGTVSAYFMATRKYRVLFFNGHCEDLTYQDVVDSLPLSSPSDEEGRKRKLTDGGGATAAPSASPKKLKAMERSSSSSTESEPTRKIKGEGGGDADSNLGDLSPHFDTSQGLTKVFAHNITRSVLFFVVSSSSDATKRQLAILSDATLDVRGERGNRYYTIGGDSWMEWC